MFECTFQPSVAWTSFGTALFESLVSDIVWFGDLFTL